MPNLQTIQSTISAIPTGPPLVIAIVAGTSGIGSYIARAFARAYTHHGPKLRIYIIGRNVARAEEVISYGRATSPGSDWRFVQVRDLSILAEVERVCLEVIRLEEESEGKGKGRARLDCLYMGQALGPLVESPLTSEGLDTQLSLLYYSRISFITHFTPLLLAANGSARVISIFAGATQDAHSPSSPLPIGAPSKSAYSVTSVRKHTCFMKTFAFEHLAATYPRKISFTHIYPGLVDGPTFYSKENPWWWGAVWAVVKWVAGWYMTSEETCGDVMVSLAGGRYVAKGEREGDGDVAVSSKGGKGGGCYSVGQRGDEQRGVMWEKLRREDTGETVLGHTVEVLEGARRRNAEGSRGGDM